MKTLYLSFEEIMNITKERKIVCFGAGRYFHKIETFGSEFAEKIAFVVDNNPALWGKTISVGNYNYAVCSPEKLDGFAYKDLFLIVTVAKEEDIFVWLNEKEKYASLEGTSIRYLLGMFEDYNVSKITVPDNLRLTADRRIPKVLHYCWFGGKAVPDKYKEWMKSWKKYCPDYEIVEWNESNYDYKQNEYMYEAYKAKKVGGVPDYARLDIIHKYGGVYLDTDVELVRNIDELLYQEGFCGFQEDSYISFGLGFGARPELPIMKELRDQYANEEFLWQRSSAEVKTGPMHETEKLQEYGLIKNGEYQRIAGLTVYPTEVLSGINRFSGKGHINSNTFAVHHYAASWHDKDLLRKRDRYRELYNILFNQFVNLNIQ